jgi:peptidoglycan/xylan/chitin deacetylase (PgdA/CDA1 family)
MVILAFADSKEGAYSVAFPAMRARGVRGVAFVVVAPVVQGEAGRLTAEQLDELDAAGWDIASHGYTHDDPIVMTAQQLDDNLRDAHEWLLDRGYSRGARHYGPPSNNCDQRVLDAALKYYKTVWCRQYSSLPAGYEYGVGACGNNTDWSRLQQAFDRLVGQPNRVLRCTFHALVPALPTGNQADLARVNQILDYLAAQKIQVVALSDLLDGTIPASP